MQVLLDALVAPTNQTPPAITGTAESGQPLTASAGTWNGTNPILFSYSWLRCDSAGANCAPIGSFNSVYTLAGADVGHRLKVRVTASNDQGGAFADSAPTAVVVGVPPQNTTIPSITGSPQDGQLLGVTPGSWTGNGTITLSYQWLRCDNAGGNCAPIDFATATTYRAAPADEGHAIRVRETATDDIGTASADSTATAPIAPGSPVNLTPASLFGTARDGSSLTAANGTWAGSPPITFGYQWQRCDTIADCANIAGVNATLQSYQLTSADVGHKVRAIVTASNGVGSPATSTTDLSDTVVAAPPSNTTLPSIAGTPAEGQNLTANDGTWTGTPTIGFARQWERCDNFGNACTDIGGQTGVNYLVTAADIDHTIRVRVTATNGVGNQTKESAQTAVVVGQPPAVFTNPQVTGTTRDGQTLTETVGTFSGSSATVTHQWQRCDTGGGSCTPIAGAIGETYLQASVDVGHTIRVVDTATNTAGQATAISAPTAVVAAAPPTLSVAPSISGTARSARS